MMKLSRGKSVGKPRPIVHFSAAMAKLSRGKSVGKPRLGITELNLSLKLSRRKSVGKPRQGVTQSKHDRPGNGQSQMRQERGLSTAQAADQAAHGSALHRGPFATASPQRPLWKGAGAGRPQKQRSSLSALPPAPLSFVFGKPRKRARPPAGLRATRRERIPPSWSSLSSAVCGTGTVRPTGTVRRGGR
jgi:hypothetical protein